MKAPGIRKDGGVAPISPSGDHGLHGAPQVGVAGETNHNLGCGGDESQRCERLVLEVGFGLSGVVLIRRC